MFKQWKEAKQTPDENHLMEDRKKKKQDDKKKKEAVQKEVKFSFLLFWTLSHLYKTTGVHNEVKRVFCASRSLHADSLCKICTCNIVPERKKKEWCFLMNNYAMHYKARLFIYIQTHASPEQF